jgi:hypothetical protein
MSKIPQTPWYAACSLYTFYDVANRVLYTHHVRSLNAILTPPRLPERSLPCDVLNLLEFGAHLDDRVSNQARVE